MGSPLGQDNLSCFAVLLAAGRASRYGKNKITEAKLDGVPIGLISAKLYQSCVPTIAVVKPDDEPTKHMFEEAGLTVVTAENARLGMGNSLAAGVSAISNKGATHCLIALADMPLVTEATLRRLIDTLCGGENIIVRPSYNGVVGNPVGFARRYFAELMALDEDQGAKQIVAQHDSAVVTVEVADSGVIYDIDKPQDLTQAHQHN